MHSSEEKFSLAIAGCGSVGVSFLYQFLHLLEDAKVPARMSILIVDPRHRVGSGVPYQPGDKTALLNTRTGTTSATFKDAAHFHQWVIEHADDLASDYPDLDTSRNGFVPRSVFGRYLEDLYLQTLERAHRIGVQIVRCTANLCGVELSSNCDVRLLTDAGPAYSTQRLLLCTGNPASRPYGDLCGTPNYIHSPYPADRNLQRIPTDARVCVIGSGLTAIDTAIALHRNNGVRDIVCVSKNGRLQSVKSLSTEQPTLRTITPENLAKLSAERGRGLTLAELAQMFAKEVEDYSGRPFKLDEILLPELACHDYLRHEIETAEEGSKPWQATLYAINNIIDIVWKHLSDGGRHEFLSRYRDDFMSYKVAIPLKNARILDGMMSAGSLRIVKVLGEIEYLPGEAVYHGVAQEAHDTRKFDVQADYVINATGFPISYAKSADPLVASLLTAGLTVESPFGGLTVDFDSSNLLDKSGRRIKRISCLGTATTGTYFWTNGMDVNSRIAHRLATRWAAEWQPGEQARWAVEA